MNVIDMKAQGLPMRFIVIAVMAMLVLIVVIMFLFSGFRTETVSSQTAVNSCNSKCLQENQRDYSYPSTTPFCETTQDVKGLGTGLKCDDLTSCEISRLGCSLSCSGTTTSCT